MKRLRTLLGIGLGLAVVAGAGWYISQNGTTSTPAARQGRFAAGAATPVGIAAAAKGEIPVVVRALGTVTALNTVNVKTQITGQLIKVEFKEGQMVKQGDLLAVVDPRPYDVALQQAIGTMQKDEALLNNAQTDLERYKKLVAQDSIARQQYDTQISLVRQYEPALVVDQAQVDAAKLNVTYTKILAPLTGRIGLRLVDHERGFILTDQRDLRVVLLAGDGVLGDQLLVAFQVDLRILQQRLVLLLLADRLLERHVVRPRIDHGQEVALLDHLAFLELDLDELAGDLGLHVDGVERRDRSQGIENNRNIALGRGGDAYRNERSGIKPASLARGGRAVLGDVPSSAHDNGKTQADSGP